MQTLGGFMAFVSCDSESFFSEKSYKSYLEQKTSIHNERLRGEDETFFDAMLSEEADFTKTPEGREILEIIKGF
jgi:hypothetical protein